MVAEEAAHVDRAGGSGDGDDSGSYPGKTFASLICETCELYWKRQ
jgi:hypothetical protein